MRRLIFLTAGLLVPALLMAQLDRVWVNTYNSPYGTHEEVANEINASTIAVDKDGYVYVCGSGFGPVTSNDFVTIKYDPTTGERLWVSYYDGPALSGDWATAIAVDDAGGVYVTGSPYSDREGGGSYDYATIKYNASDGAQQWASRYNGPGNGYDHATAIAVDNAGGVYVTGFSYGSGPAYDYATVKYDANGNQQWVARYNGPDNGDDRALALAVDGSGNAYVTGHDGGPVTYSAYATIKYDANGNQQWVARYEGAGNFYDAGYAIAVDGSGNAYVTGFSYGPGTYSDYATVKYDANGNQRWVARYNGPGNGNDYASALVLDGSGNAYVTGADYGSGPWYDYATVKYDANGNQQWVARYEGAGNDYDAATGLVVDGSGNAYVTGYSIGSGSGYDYLTAAYDVASGVELGVDRYAGSAGIDDFACAIATDAFGSVYVTGYCINEATSRDIVTIKYNHPAVIATVDIDPNKLNLKSKGKWVTGYIELPEAFSVEDIDFSTVAISAIDGDLLDPPLYREGPTEVGDYDHDNISDLMVKFDRQELVDVLIDVGHADDDNPDRENPADVADCRRVNTGVLMVKFDRQKLIGVLIDMGYGDGDKPELTVTGGLVGGGTFKGVDTIELIDNKGGGQGKAAGLPERISIQPTSPNPFKLTTTIGYGLPAETRVRLEVYSPTGQRVATLVDRFEGAGYHSASWNGRDDAGRELAAGIYLFRFEAGTYKTTRKTQLLR